MKSNILYKFIIGAAVATTGFTSCDYLDVVPVEQATIDDAYKRPEQTLAYLYSCYNGLKSWNPVDYYNEDVASTDEFVLPPSWNGDAYNIQTNQRSSATGGGWTWRYCGYDPIRTCHMFLEIIDKAPNLTPEQRTTWRAEAEFLIGYYHFMVLRKYGPCPIMDHAYPSDVTGDNMPGRSHYDAVTKYIISQIDKAMPNLPDRWTGGDWGRVDKVVAKAIKGRVLLYAASPQWNGNTLYESGRLKWENTQWETEGYGKQLVNPIYSQKKWEDARDACKEALDFALLQDLALYKESNFEELKQVAANKKDFMKYVFRMRYALLSRANSTGKCQEVVWGLADQSLITTGCLPRRMFKKTDNTWQHGWSGVSPTLEAIKQFYTSKGYPITDTNHFYPQDEWYDVAGENIISQEPSYLDDLDANEIIKLNTNREPRFYAWMAYSGGEYGTKLVKDAPLILNMRLEEKQGYNKDDVRDYCRTGYLCQKWAHPGLAFSDNGSDNGGSLTSPRPIIRMAELYLNLAECYAALGEETNFLTEINAVRTRAGINALTKTDIPGGIDDMTEWVHRERFIEFYGEGIRFYDMRRWLKGKEIMGKGLHGLNMVGILNPSISTFNQETVMPEYTEVSWDDRLYLMPLYYEEADKSENLIQAPGY
ncbi:RagB/SusD family nutrient uptake outer membrane protein [Bacteroides finegoldii]|uniref:RagB/SusD family nutrient uptake outer membrane protein n=1 Tax=Bacteroides finegoldii TaxID=338188 RepID=UPI00189CB428|nr:RagB/SusD family nutrient uptake outer membrane protein [Bacteroides finegoldii]